MSEPALLNLDAADVQDLERRASVRYPCILDGTCLPITAGHRDSWPAQVLNVSTDGVALLVKHQFILGTLLAVEIHNEKRTVSRTQLGRVVHLRAHSLSEWVVGCAFTSKLSDADIQALL